MNNVLRLLGFAAIAGLCGLTVACKPEEEGEVIPLPEEPGSDPCEGIEDGTTEMSICQLDEGGLAPTHLKGRYAATEHDFFFSGPEPTTAEFSCREPFISPLDEIDPDKQVLFTNEIAAGGEKTAWLSFFCGPTLDIHDETLEPFDVATQNNIFDEISKRHDGTPIPDLIAAAPYCWYAERDCNDQANPSHLDMSAMGLFQVAEGPAIPNDDYTGFDWSFAVHNLNGGGAVPDRHNPDSRFVSEQMPNDSGLVEVNVDGFIDGRIAHTEGDATKTTVTFTAATEEAGAQFTSGIMCDPCTPLADDFFGNTALGSLTVHLEPAEGDE